MSGFLDKIKQKILNEKKKTMIMALKNNQGKKSYSGVRSKTISNGNETVTFTTKVDSLKKAIKDDVTQLTKEFDKNADRLLDYVETHGTKVHRIYNADNVLSKVCEHTGFITPLEGSKAAYISTLIGSELKNNKTDAMFILSADSKIDYPMLLREFYLWYSYKMNLAGFDFETQEIFKKYMAEKRNPGMSKMDYEGMANLKEALSRDFEANEFIMEYVRNTDVDPKIYKKLQDGGANI